MEETLRLTVAGELLGIRVYDHIILSHGKYYSLLEAGKMPDAVKKAATAAELNNDII
jgi:hypothetical protein